MPSCEVLRHVTLVRTDVSEERIASIVRETRIGDRVFIRSVLQFLVTANVFPSSMILFTLTMEATCSCETSVLTRVTWRNMPEDVTLYSHRRDNLESYNVRSL
jgi:hypothetical protein